MVVSHSIKIKKKFVTQNRPSALSDFHTLQEISDNSGKLFVVVKIVQQQKPISAHELRVQLKIPTLLSQAKAWRLKPPQTTVTEQPFSITVEVNYIIYIFKLQYLHVL